MKQKSPILFYFDFSSPYAAIAAQWIDGVGERTHRKVIWRPFLLGAVFPKTGSRPLLEQPMKADYTRHDLCRLARYLGVRYEGLPDPFPFSAVAPSRLFYALAEYNLDQAVATAKEIFWQSFVLRNSMSAPQSVASAVQAIIGLDQAATLALMSDVNVKAILRHRVNEALAAGIFGAPFFIVEDEPFWGADRMAMLESFC